MSGEREQDTPDEGEGMIDYVEAHGAGSVPMLPPPPDGQAGDAQLVGEPVAAEGWVEEGVREHLVMGGEMLHAFIGVSDEDWKMSERDLERMAPPLTRILNRHEALARAAAFSDPILFTWGAGLYSYRSVLQARAARMDAAEAQAQQDAVERPHEAYYERPEGAQEPSNRSPRAQAMHDAHRQAQQGGDL